MKNTNKLLFGIFGFTFVPMLVFSGLVYYFGRTALTNFVIERLADVNEVKRQELDKFFSTVRPRTTPLTAVESRRDALVLLAGKASVADRAGASRVIDDAIAKDYATAELEEVLFVRTDQTVVYAYSARPETVIGAPLSSAYQSLFASGQNDAHAFAVVSSVGEPVSVGVAHPVLDDEKFPVGVVLYRYSLQSVIDSIASATGLSESGESFLVMNEDDETILYLSPLQADVDATLTKRSPFFAEEAAAMRSATSGEIGTGAGIDYRGVKVFSAWSPAVIPNWGIVTKIDQTEALSALLALNRSLVVLGVLLAAALFIGIEIAIRLYVKRTLRSLEAVATKIEEERYDEAHVDRKLLYSEDEFGALGTSLHHIIEQHKTHRHS